MLSQTWGGGPLVYVVRGLSQLNDRSLVSDATISMLRYVVYFLLIYYVFIWKMKPFKSVPLCMCVISSSKRIHNCYVLISQLFSNSLMNFQVRMWMLLIPVLCDVSPESQSIAIYPRCNKHQGCTKYWHTILFCVYQAFLYNVHTLFTGKTSF